MLYKMAISEACAGVVDCTNQSRGKIQVERFHVK